MDILIVVDMQNDFINGSLGTKEAELIVSNVVDKAKNFNGDIIFTRDTHFDNYLSTQEGKNLPVEHCIKDTIGWQIHKDLLPYVKNPPIDKITFGSSELISVLKKYKDISSITLVGLCTDICVVSNAIVVKAFFPEIPLMVDASCCAGVTPQSHNNALSVLKTCQVKVINE